MDAKQKTLNFYDNHADEYAQHTRHGLPASTYSSFLSFLPEKSHIMDAGCGPGRDSVYFQKQGHQVAAFDASPAMVKLAKAKGISTLCHGFLDLPQGKYEGKFDGIWASASLLHLPKSELSQAITNLQACLKPGGVMHASFKQGVGESFDAEQRYFSFYTKAELQEIFGGFFPKLKIMEEKDSLGRDGTTWLYVTARGNANSFKAPGPSF